MCHGVGTVNLALSKDRGLFEGFEGFEGFDTSTTLSVTV